MEMFYRIISLLGGLALFLYGMRTMGDGLKSSSGGAMKAALAKVTNRSVTGFLLGMLVTCMIQSSTATIVLTVGLVGAGFLTFRQSTSIVLGANVGTAITAQIIRLMDLDAGSGSILYFFKSDNLAPVALIIGISLIMFVKGRSTNAVGIICVGFGTLFVGLMNMSNAVSTMSDQLSGLLTRFEGNYVLGFLSGLLVTGIIQSSSAVVGILQSIASSVGIRFCAVVPVIIGVNIGDCLTTYLVCRIGAKPEQIRTCVVHMVYNFCAAALLCVGLVVLRMTGILGDGIWYDTLRSGGVANIHGLFRLIPAVLFLPLSGAFANFAVRVVPDRAEDEEDAEIERNLRELDTRLITNPGLALAESHHLICHMADVAIHNYDGAVSQAFEYDPKRTTRIYDREGLLDRMADASNEYLVAVSPYITLKADNRNQIYQLKALTCFERIGDLAMNMSGNVESLKNSGHELPAQALRELRVVTGAVRESLGLAVEAFKYNHSETALRVEPLEEVIDDLVEVLKDTVVQRSAEGLFDVHSGIEYQNMLQNLERISDQCSNLAVYHLASENDSINGREHEYLRELHHSNNQDYMADFKAGYSKYFGLLDAVRNG